MAYGRYGQYPPMQGGGGFYSPYSAKPQWGAGIAQTIQQLMAQKQMQKQQKQQGEQQSFENRMRILNYLKGMEPTKREKALSRLVENKVITQEQKDMALAGVSKVEAPEERIKRIKGEATARAEVAAKFKKEPDPTQFEVKKGIWDAKLRTGEATQVQYDEVMWGVKPKPTQEEILAKKANPRQANDTWLSRAWNTIDKVEAEKKAKKAKARPVVMGISLDMPYKYNLAVLNKNDRVATPEDLQLIQEYDDMFEYFNTQLMGKGITNFKDFMKSDLAKDKALDKAQIKKWYELYGKKKVDLWPFWD